MPSFSEVSSVIQRSSLPTPIVSAVPKPFLATILSQFEAQVVENLARADLIGTKVDRRGDAGTLDDDQYDAELASDGGHRDALSAQSCICIRRGALC
jgi:hypothetical protein